MELIVKNLSKQFAIQSGALLQSKGHVQALDRVTFSVPAGQHLGIVGESGSGKTTLAKIFAGFYGANEGSAHFGESDLLNLKRAERARLVQMVFQDPFASLNPKLLLRTQIIEALRAMGHSRPETEAHGLMDQVGLPTNFLSRYPHQLSGGQRQRFAIARALAAHPKLLLADEPVSSLDIAVQAQIINLLNELKQKMNFTLIVISHDLAVVSNTCDQILVMKDGRVAEYGSTPDIIHHPNSEYTQTLLKAIPVI